MATAAPVLPSAVPANFENLQGRMNFSEWKSLEDHYHLEDRNLYAACTTETADNDIDRRARSAIVSSVSSNVIKEILTCETAKSMWDRLVSLYEDNNPNRFLTLNQEMFSTKFENCKDMTDYIEKMRSIGIKMRTILPSYPDQAVAANILTNLPSYFRPLVMALENSVQQLTTDLVCEKLLAEYTKMDNLEQNAFTVKSLNSDSKFLGKCNLCGRIGHKAKFCRSKRNKAYQSGKRDTRSEKSRGSTENNPKVKEAWVLTTQEHAYNSANDEPWIVDSGTDRHMTSHKEWFIEFIETTPCPIRTGGKVIHSIGEGNIILNILRNNEIVEVELKNVLYVPELTANLISVKYLANKLNILGIFDANYCKLIHKETHKVLATATAKGNNLYHLDIAYNFALTSSSNVSINIWHKRLAHLSCNGLQRLQPMVIGMNFSDEFEDCVPCIKGKIHRQPFQKKKPTRAKEVLELIHSDLCGPMETKSHGGARYFLSLIDDKTRMTFVTFLKSKDEVYQKFIDFKVYIEKQTDKKLKAIRSDRGTEYVNLSMLEFFRKEGIHHQKSLSYVHEQNGVAERCNRTLVERARAMLSEANLDSRFWAEAISTSNYCKNRSPTIAVNGKTPYEAWTGYKPDLSHLKIFGCQAYCHIPKCQRKKWDDKSKEFIFVGYSQESKGYRLMDPETFKIIEARDVVFLESKNCILPNLQHSKTDVQFYDEEVIFATQKSPKDSASESQQNELRSQTPSDAPIRRSMREPKVPAHFKDFELLLHQHQCNLMSTSIEENFENVDVPLTYNDAIHHPDATKWKGAISEELEAHKRNKTWDIVPLPNGCKPIRSKWVFKIKHAADGSPDRFKARLVAKGCSQRAGVDYTETFSPVVRYETLRILLALATIYDWSTDHLDAVVAFLQGTIEETIYMELPEGLDVSKERGGNLVCRLQKGIYGLKQSGRAWYTKLDENLKELGMKCADFDCCVYHMNKNDKILLVAIYVDDLIIFSSCKRLKCWIKTELCKRFEMKDLTELNYCLGIQINRDREKGITTMDQSTYIESILHRFSMHESKPVSTPTDINQKLSKSCDNDEDENLLSVYQSAIGYLLYAAKGTRPDIAHVVSLLCQFCSKPSKLHWNAVKRIMRYLNGSKEVKLQFVRSGNTEFIGYCDSDFAGCPDDRKSTTGFIFKLANAAVTWQSKKQTTVASSTVEAEYIALSSATKEALWLRKFMDELNLPAKEKPLKIFCDNKGAIDLSKNSMFHARTKHIDVVHHVTRQAVKSNKIVIEKTSTETMIADSLTKAVPKEKHEWCMNNMGLFN